MTHLHYLVRRTRRVVAGSLVAAALLVPLGASASPAGALSSSPFCTAVFSWAHHPIPTPTKLTVAGYRSWVKSVLPYYEKMEATAPNAATKRVLADVVLVLKAYSNSTNLSQLATFEKAHHAAFAKDVQALAKSIISCATSGILQLP